MPSSGPRGRVAQTHPGRTRPANRRRSRGYVVHRETGRTWVHAVRGVLRAFPAVWTARGHGGEPRRAGCRRTPSLPRFGLGGTSRGRTPRAPSGVVARGVTWLNRNGEPLGGRCPASRLEGPTARAEVQSLGQSGRAPLFEGCVLTPAWHRIGAKDPRSGPTFSNRVHMFTGSRCRHAGQRGGWSLI